MQYLMGLNRNPVPRMHGLKTSCRESLALHLELTWSSLRAIEYSTWNIYKHCPQILPTVTALDITVKKRFHSQNSSPEAMLVPPRGIIPASRLLPKGLHELKDDIRSTVMLWSFTELWQSWGRNAIVGRHVKKRMLTAMAKQQRATYWLFLSPILAHFQKTPSNLPTEEINVKRGQLQLVLYIKRTVIG